MGRFPPPLKNVKTHPKYIPNGAFCAPGCTPVELCAAGCTPVKLCAPECTPVEFCAPGCTPVELCAPGCTPVELCAPAPVLALRIRMACSICVHIHFGRLLSFRLSTTGSGTRPGIGNPTRDREREPGSGSRIGTAESEMWGSRAPRPGNVPTRGDDPAPVFLKNTMR